MTELYLSGGHFHSGKQRTSAVTLVAVAESIQVFPIGQPQPTLRSFQHLYVRFLILYKTIAFSGGLRYKPHDVGCFRSELRICVNTRTAAALELDLVVRNTRHG